MRQDILTLDKNWTPHSWIDVEEAILLESKELVLDHLGESIVIYHGGVNRITGQKSFIETNSIIVVDGAPSMRKYKEPALTNSGLFQRDRFLCGYCGNTYHAHELTRDHIHPQSKGGRDTWMNTITACKDCNSLKGDIVQGQKLPNGIPGPQFTGKMEPLYLPYVPCKAEHMIMKGRHIKFDQMQFLLERVSNKKSRIFDYANDLFKGKKFESIYR